MIKILTLSFILVFFISSGCTLVDYESTKTESSPLKEVNDDKSSTLEDRIDELERRVKELEDKLKAQW